MFKLIKTIFFLLLLFFGLYFFGDFKINDTNVRDYLQKTVTMPRVLAVKDQIVNFYHEIIGLFSDQKQPAPPTENTTTTQEIKLDDVTQKDRKELMKLIEKNLDKTSNQSEK